MDLDAVDVKRGAGCTYMATNSGSRGMAIASTVPIGNVLDYKYLRALWPARGDNGNKQGWGFFRRSKRRAKRRGGRQLTKMHPPPKCLSNATTPISVCSPYTTPGRLPYLNTPALLRFFLSF